MTWFAVIGLALFAFLFLAFVCKVPQGMWTTMAAAIVLGLAGYGLQASPGLSGAPKESAQNAISNPEAVVEMRNALADRGIPLSNQWMIIADGLARNGQFAESAQVLKGAVKDDPKNAEAWLALANSLMAHSEGLLTPASQYAYRKASEAAPDSAGPPFFQGMAMVQSGRLADARQTWAGLLERSSPQDPWYDDLKMRLSRLDVLIAEQGRSLTAQ